MKRKRLSFCVLLAALMIISACGTGGQQGENNNGADESANGQVAETEQDPIRNVVMNAEIHQNEQTILFDITLENQGSEEVQLTFPSGQQIEITVTNNQGERIYTYSMNKSFIQAIQELPIATGEVAEWHEEWVLDEGTPSGEYEVVVQVVATHINGEEIGENALQVKSDFQVEINNTAFRNIEVSGDKGEYVVTGEARVFEGNFFYTVEEGHEYVVDETNITVNNGAPAWEPFEINISIPEDQLPVNGTLTMNLYEKSAKDNSVINQFFVKLDEIGY